MKHISTLKRFWLLALVAVVSTLLYAFGGHEPGASEILATTAVVALTEDEKAAFSETEQKMLLAVKKLIKNQEEAYLKGHISKEELNAELTQLKDGLSTKEIKELKDEINKLEGILKTQGTELSALKENGGVAKEYSLEDAWAEHLDAIREKRTTGSGFVRFNFGLQSEDKGTKKTEKSNEVNGITSLFRQKVPAITSIANSTASIPVSVTNPYSPFPQQLDEIVAVRRNPNFAVNYVDVGSTNSATITWTEEGNSEGDAAITAEGGLKPLQDKKFVDRISKAKKIAGHIVITEEMETDVPRIATAVRRLFQENVMRKYDDQVWADIVAVAPGYTSTALNDSIENPDDYAAIGAAFCQLENLNAYPDTIAINPADKWRMKLIKGNDGHYVTPPFVVGDHTFDGVRVVTSNKVTAGNFLVAEMGKYKVDIYKTFSLRVGWQNDDFVRNQFTIVGEIRFHSYVATNDLVGFCYASFATVKAAIEAPAPDEE